MMGHLVWLILLVTIVAACQPDTVVQQPVAENPTPTLLAETAVSPTDTPLPTETATVAAEETATSTSSVQATPTTVATTQPTATFTPLPTATEAPGQIIFDPGAISKTLQRTLPVGGNDEFTFWATAGQLAEIAVASSNGSANFSLVGMADGQPYKRFENEDRTWSGTLLSSGDYRLTVTSLSRPIDYTLTLTIYPQEVALPQTLPKMAEWIGQQRQNGTPTEYIQLTLTANSWLAEWHEHDLDGDGSLEWLIILKQDTGSVFGPAGDFLVVSQAGLVYRHYAKFIDDGFRLPTLHYVADMTGDGLPEAAVSKQFCGAHTCTHYYDIVGAPAGTVQSLVPTLSDHPSPAIAMASSEFWFEDWTDDNRLDLVQHGGFISSAGAGPYQRGYTEVWAWDAAANQFALAKTIQDPSNYRFHTLYDANNAYEAADWTVAINLYEDVVNSTHLEDGVGLTVPESTYTPSRQFAAFRLMLIYLHLGDMENATAWSGWLYSTYPDSAIEDGVIAFWEDYNFNQSIAPGCVAATNVLATYPNPTGALVDLGYALPSLTAESICPVN